MTKRVILGAEHPIPVVFTRHLNDPIIECTVDSGDVSLITEFSTESALRLISALQALTSNEDVPNE